MKLSAVLIVKNEKDHIKDVLSSVAGVDEIIVCDTGSTDNTVELAREMGAIVDEGYTWNDDFAEARNYAMKKATGDWILSIDGDEILEEGGVEKIRKIIAEAKPEQLHFSVEMQAAVTKNPHKLPRIFRNDGSVEWKGIAHETLYPVQRNLVDVVITYGHSTAHALDPDRMLRILEKAVNSEDGTPRDVYYYAREFWYRKNYQRAADLFYEYISISEYPAELADAYLYLSRCYFILQRGNEAREMCLEAIKINPDFKEALLFMAELHFEPWKHKWLRLAEAATNEDVLFTRV